MTHESDLEAKFHDVLIDVFSGTDMASNEWIQMMYQFWLTTREQLMIEVLTDALGT